MQKLICDEVVKSGILQSNLSTSKFLFYAPTLPPPPPPPPRCQSSLLHGILFLCYLYNIFIYYLFTNYLEKL